MKRSFVISFICLCSCIAAMANATIPRVISDVELGKGYDPQLSQDGSTVMYLTSEGERYVTVQTADTWVSNDNLQLVLHQDNKATRLTPDGEDAHYIWSSLSPDGTRIVYNTARGTSVCDLKGKPIAYLGHLNAPVWYSNDYVVGMHDFSDGDRITSSSIAIRHLTTGEETLLTSSQVIAMYPSVSAESGRVVYTTDEGAIRMIQLNLTDQPVSAVLPQVLEAPQMMRTPRKTPRTSWETFSDVKIYINPGHGGHASNDRNMKIYPFESGDTLGFWESNSNLDKGLALNEWLKELGVQTMMSRTLNRDGGGNDADILKSWLTKGQITKEEYDDMLVNGDDRALSAIVAEANAYDADFMVSIHSNAGGPSNYVLELYAGKDADDTHTYPTPTPVSNESRAISTIIGNNLICNVLTPWSQSTPMIYGDKTFGREGMHWSDGYGVLRGLKVPGVINEGSMHDYIPETYRLMNIDYKKKEAFYLMKSFLTYFLKYTLPWGVIGGQVRDNSNKQLFPDIVRRANTYDELEPLCGATVELLQSGQVKQTYTTDNLYNGIFFFWNLEPGEYVVHIAAAGYYDRYDTMQVVAGDIVYDQALMSMKRSTRPEVTSYSPCVQPTDSQEVTISIDLNFNWDMMEEPTKRAFHISPEVEGKLEFSNSQKTLTFTPAKSLEKGTEYTVTLDTTACHPDSAYLNHLKEPFSFVFRTKNRDRMHVLQTYPVDGATEVDLKPTVYLLFDNVLYSNTQPSLFTVSDGKTTYSPARSAFKKNTVSEPYGNVRFDVTTALNPNTTYTVTINGSVKDVNGVKLGDDVTFTFTTGDGVVQRQGEILNSLDAAWFTVDYDKSSGVKSKKITADKSCKVEGTASNRITYAFDPTQKSQYLLLRPEDVSLQFTSKQSIIMDVYGDLSGNTLEAEFSVDGDIQMIPLCTIDFVGWRYVEVPCNALPEGVTYQLTGLKLNSQYGILSNSGDIYIDRLARMETPATDVQSSVAETSAPCKRIENGQLLIHHNGVDYTPLGTIIK